MLTPYLGSDLMKMAQMTIQPNGNIYYRANIFAPSFANTLRS